MLSIKDSLLGMWKKMNLVSKNKMEIEQSLKDKVILLTGGTTGLGRETVLMALKEGAKVAFCWFHSVEHYECLVSHLESAFSPDDWLGLRADVSKEKDVENLFEKIIEKFKRVDIVISNAAISRDSLLALLSEESWDDIIGTNLTGGFLVCRQAIRSFLALGIKGHLLIVGSLAQTGTPSNACYAASKGGLLGMTQTIANIYAPQGITANMICFGLIDTEMTRYYSDSSKQVLIEASPLKISSTAAEAAAFLLFFARENMTNLTGQVMMATNGITDFPMNLNLVR
jgi:NAD(P)-dependent dehydrogenase (short-subunit alcohol dehydrogenase family)